jgi:hypothetical protein
MFCFFPYLYPLDFYIWKPIKSTVYALKVTEFQDFQQRTQNKFYMIGSTTYIFYRVRQSHFRCTMS